jgi:P pilus assembly chaperone PapD
MIRILFFLSSFFVLTQSYAIGVKPMIIQLDATQQGASGSFVVINNEDKELEVNVSPSAFTYEEQGFKPLPSSPDDLSSYLVFSPKSLILKPKENRQVRFNARFLPSTAAGEYKTMLFATQAIPVNAENKQQTQIIPRMGVAVYVRLGDVKPDLTVKGALYKDKKVFLVLNNAGKASVFPRAEWTLEGAGKTMSNKGLNTAFDPISVVAGGKRNMEFRFDGLNQLPMGNYKLSGTLFWGDKDENTLKFEQSLVVGH